MNELLSYLEEHRDRHLKELFELLRIPSVSTDKAHASDVRRAAEWTRDALAATGVKAELHETAGNPIVYGEWLEAEGAPTVLVYGHYDVQPPDPLELWKSPPFEPEVRDGKIYGRGTADDKGQFFAHVKAAEAHMKVHGRLPVNVKYLIEGEEEVGSKNLGPYITENKERLAADTVLISDTHMFAPGVPSITYGLRGLTYLEVTIEGPDHDLHSGLYGGSVANPINVLCNIVAQLLDGDGRITVPGFYDDVRELTTEERQAWTTLPFSEEGWRDQAGSNELVGEKGYSTLERVWARPTLDCCGIVGGFTGQGAKTVLPSIARAKISCRLVPDQDPDNIADLLERHLRELAPSSVRISVERMHGGRPVIVDTNGPEIQAARRALSKAFGGDAVNIRGGGSIPIVADFDETLGCPCVLMGFGLPDDRLHSPNEKYDLSSFFGGIRAAALFLHEL